MIVALPGLFSYLFLARSAETPTAEAAWEALATPLTPPKLRPTPEEKIQSKSNRQPKGSEDPI